MQKTLYDVLELSLSASAEAIDASHEGLRNALQPKVDAGDQEARMRLVAVREAYQTLSNSARRRMYDASLETRESLVSPPSTPGHGPSDDFGYESHARKSVLIKRVIVIGLVAIGVYGVMSYRAGEAERLEKLRVFETQKQAIEMEKLAIERAKMEAAAAEKQKRLELEKQRFEEFARIRAEGEEQERQRVQAERARAEEIAIQDKTRRGQLRQRQEQYARDREQAERERKLNSEKAQLLRICQERYGRPDC